MQKREVRVEGRQQGDGRNFPAQLLLREGRVGVAEERSEIEQKIGSKVLAETAQRSCCYERAE